LAQKITHRLICSLIAPCNLCYIAKAMSTPQADRPEDSIERPSKRHHVSAADDGRKRAPAKQLAPVIGNCSDTASMVVQSPVGSYEPYYNYSAEQLAEESRKLRDGYDQHTELLRMYVLGSIRKGDKVVDFGCGEGRTTFKIAQVLAELCPKIYGVDISATMLEAAKANWQIISPQLGTDDAVAEQVQFLQGSWDSLPEVCQPAKVLHFGNVLHYAENPLSVLECLVPALSPGGVIVVEEPFAFASSRLDPTSADYDSDYHARKLRASRASFSAICELAERRPDFKCIHSEENDRHGVVVVQHVP